MRRTLIVLSLLAMPVCVWADGMQAAFDAYQSGEYEHAQVIWLERAEQGDANAAVNLGHLYERGLGVPADLVQALAWYEFAADLGDPHAQYQVGLMYELGLGTAPDMGVAHYWYERAVAFEYGPREFREPDDVRRRGWVLGLW
jgi:TPR repeat protein